jgi:hypothetical protein
VPELSNALMGQVRSLLASPVISANAVSKFLAEANSVTNGVDVTFRLTDITGVSTVTLLRNYVLDPATATVLQSWQPAVADYTWADSDGALQAQGQAFYWLLLAPQGATGKSVTVGPQQIVLNPQLVAPVEPTEISASSGPLVNGTVKITANVSGVTDSVKIYVSGYHGNVAEVAVASSASSPLQFVLDATGETVTLEAIGVSAGGVETPAGPTTAITLNGTATIPAKVQGIVVTQIGAGNQVNWPSSKDAGPTYKLYRAQRGQTFLLATLLATVTGSAGTLNYLDTTGLAGDWEYFVIATNGVGDSVPSDPSSPAILFTSASMPANTPANTSNNATVDSIDTGTATLIRIYGPGGVGTAYDRLTGFGTLTRPNGTIGGIAYLTPCVVMWTGTAFVIATNYPATLPDDYEPVGGLTTTGATGVVGTGATVDLVIDGGGHVIQANPVLLGSDYAAATVNVAGGGGAGAQIQANVDLPSGTIPSYTVLNGGTGYATAPTGTVVGAGAPGDVGGGGSTGGSSGNRGDFTNNLDGF